MRGSTPSSRIVIRRARRFPPCRNGFRSAPFKTSSITKTFLRFKGKSWVVRTRQWGRCRRVRPNRPSHPDPTLLPKKPLRKGRYKADLDRQAYHGFKGCQHSNRIVRYNPGGEKAAAME